MIKSEIDFSSQLICIKNLKHNKLLSLDLYEIAENTILAEYSLSSTTP